MVPSPCSPLAFLSVVRALVFTQSHKDEGLAFEQYLTVLQETHTNSFIGVRNGSLEPVQAKQLSQVSLEQSLEEDKSTQWRIKQNEYSHSRNWRHSYSEHFLPGGNLFANKQT